jgi:hypothetical protein
VTRKEKRRTAIAIVLATTGTAIVLALNVFGATTVVGVYVVVMGALVLAPLTRLAQIPGEMQEASLFDLALKRSRPGSTRPPELVRIERELVAGLETAGGLHQRLVPLLREAATARLAGTRRIDLVHQPDAARAALGDETWELVRPDRPAPHDRTASGLPVARLRTLLDTLEQL